MVEPESSVAALPSFENHAQLIKKALMEFYILSPKLNLKLEDVKVFANWLYRHRTS